MTKHINIKNQINFYTFFFIYIQCNFVLTFRKRRGKKKKKKRSYTGGTPFPSKGNWKLEIGREDRESEGII